MEGPLWDMLADNLPSVIFMADSIAALPPIVEREAGLEDMVRHPWLVNKAGR